MVIYKGIFIEYLSENIIKKQKLTDEAKSFNSRR